GQGRLHCKFPGLFNLANMLAVLAALQAQGFALSELLDCADKLPYVPGRMQRVALAGSDAALADFAVYIDYAHTPDALENALAALRPQVDGLLRLVFGAGGDRDKGKRAAMGEVAARLADHVVITSDNPRSEPPAHIADAISAGIPDSAKHKVVVTLDRERAIKLAIDHADKGDVVLVAGKGHERFQEQGGRRRPFDDYAVAQRALLARSAA
ncbi:MAG: UDP-N-acetylmuramoyl-L-alanyl-D-glutamate--2,6-diaminopimelate ligase, partial [Pseudomonadales bacterium]|nr:UDP-N-acetylmuramoyl-L-alanyl-D-glutamate--2,6-diaminopimelate ligase [Pseudomonadales bacterium]